MTADTDTDLYIIQKLSKTFVPTGSVIGLDIDIRCWYQKFSYQLVSSPALIGMGQDLVLVLEILVDFVFKKFS